MSRLLLCSLSLLIAAAAPVHADDRPADLEDGFRPLFDGKTLGGWEGDENTFRVRDGAIVAGSLERRVPRNEFLCTEREFEDFELRLSARLVGEGQNAGVQFRSRRIPDHHEMIGYQCDMGSYGPDETNIWGALYDESRRRKFLAVGEQVQLKKAVRPDGWNELRIRCEGPRIQIWVNGTPTVDYTEPDEKIARRGLIGLQIHGGAPAEASYKNIRIRELKPAGAGKTSFQPAARLRRPVAAVAGDEFVHVANRVGTVSVIDAATETVCAEHAIGDELSDLATVTDGWLVATDPGRHAVTLLRAVGPQLTVAGRTPVARYPVEVACDPAGTRCAVSSLWSRRLTVLAVEREADKLSLRPRHVVDLEFSPRKLLWLPVPNRLLVADSHGGRLAVVDTQAGRVVSEHEIPAHNMRGLALARDGQDVLISHQVLDAYRSTTYDHVFWGDVMQNVLRTRSVAELIAPPAGEYHPDELYGASVLGGPGDGTGDPGEIVVLPGGETVVALSGVDELMVRQSDLRPFERRKTGRRPMALAASPDGRRIYAVNTSDDSLTVLDMSDRRVRATIPLGPAVERTLAERGEELFHDATLSLDRWYSCQSCHTDGHSNGLLTDNFSDGSAGAAKRVLSLHGGADTAPWAWNGSSTSLEAQVRKSILVTQQGETAADDAVQAIAAYVRTLEPAPSLDAARGTVDADAVARGREVFSAQGCAECHQPPKYTSEAVYDVGLDDGRGGKEFNPPSLRGVSQRHRLFHDGRADSLEDVLKKYGHGGADTLTPAERADLRRFLRSL